MTSDGLTRNEQAMWTAGGSLTGPVYEAADCVLRNFGEQQPEDALEKVREELEEVEDCVCDGDLSLARMEVADLFMTVVSLAVSLGMDLTTEVYEEIATIDSRDWELVEQNGCMVYRHVDDTEEEGG